MLKQFTLILAILVMLSSGSIAAVWNVDVSHSSVGFSVRHLVVSKTTGNFKDFNGNVNFDGENLPGGSVNFTVQTSSIDTDDEKRDGHLKSGDFFEVEKYPSMTFISKKVIPGSDGKFQLAGELTIKDVTKTVTFNCEFYGTIASPMGDTRAGFSAKTKINRQDFNVTWNRTLDSGGLVVGNDVEIFLEIELIKSDR